jgi:hypothetical protein
VRGGRTAEADVAVTDEEIIILIQRARSSPAAVSRRTKAKGSARLTEIVRERGRTYHANVRAPASRQKGGLNSHGSALFEQNVNLFKEERAKSPSLTTKQLCTRAYAGIGHAPRLNTRLRGTRAYLRIGHAPGRLLACSRKIFGRHVAEFLKGVAGSNK